MQQDAHKRALIAGSIGNFIEWYEFAVYGFLATVIARNFFQLEGEAELTSLILTGLVRHRFLLPSAGCGGLWPHWRQDWPQTDADYRAGIDDARHRCHRYCAGLRQYRDCRAADRYAPAYSARTVRGR